MPFLTHHSRHSWPPFITNGPDFESTDFPSPPPLDNIDEDPFAFFVSPQSETDDPFEDVSAGIASVSHSSHDISSLTIPAKARQKLLSRWENYVEKHHPKLLDKHHVAPKKGKPSDTVLIIIDDADSPSTPPTVIEPERERARARERVPPQKRGRRTSRTLSGHRHAWREPSVDLWTVMEEGHEKKEHESTVATAAIETLDSRERLKKFGRRAGKARL